MKPVATLAARTQMLPNGTFVHSTKAAPIVPLRSDHEGVPLQYSGVQAHIQSNK